MANGSSFELMTDEQSGVPTEGIGSGGASQFISEESPGETPIPLGGEGNMSKATGWSMNFDFGEALKDAVRKLPPEDRDNEIGFTVTVTRIVGEFSKGFVPAHLEVAIQRGKHDKQPTEGRAGTTSGTNAAIQQRQANGFALRGENKQVQFLATSFPGEPILSYKDQGDERKDRTFRGSQIDISELQFSKLVTVLIDRVPDSHVVYLTLLLPKIYLPEEARDFPVETTAIVTTRKTPFTGPRGSINGLQVETYQTLPLKGTARLVIS
jgi:hypothetical protein